MLQQHRTTAIGRPAHLCVIWSQHVPDGRAELLLPSHRASSGPPRRPASAVYGPPRRRRSRGRGSRGGSGRSGRAENGARGGRAGRTRVRDDPCRSVRRRPRPARRGRRARARPRQRTAARPRSACTADGVSGSTRFATRNSVSAPASSRAQKSARPRFRWTNAERGCSWARVRSVETVPLGQASSASRTEADSAAGAVQSATNGGLSGRGPSGFGGCVEVAAVIATTAAAAPAAASATIP